MAAAARAGCAAAGKRAGAGPRQLHDGVCGRSGRSRKGGRAAHGFPLRPLRAAAALVLLAGKAGLIALPGFEQTDVISVNIGSAVEQIFAQTGAEAPDEAAAQQAAELSAETGLDVLLVWNSGVPAELETTPYETAQSGARLYCVTGQLAQAILDGYITAAYSPDDVFSDLPEKEAAYVLVRRKA